MSTEQDADYLEFMKMTRLRMIADSVDSHSSKSSSSIYSQDSFEEISEVTGLSDSDTTVKPLSTLKTVCDDTFVKSASPDLDESATSILRHEILQLMEDHHYTRPSAPEPVEPEIDEDDVDAFDLASSQDTKQLLDPRFSIAVDPRSSIAVDPRSSIALDPRSSVSTFLTTSTPQRRGPDTSCSSSPFLRVESVNSLTPSPSGSLIVHFNKSGSSERSTSPLGEASSFSMLDVEESTSIASPAKKGSRTLLDAALPSSQILNVSHPENGIISSKKPISASKSIFSVTRFTKQGSGSFISFFKQAKSAIPLFQQKSMAKCDNDGSTNVSTEPNYGVDKDSNIIAPDPMSLWFPVLSTQLSQEHLGWDSSMSVRLVPPPRTESPSSLASSSSPSSPRIMDRDPLPPSPSVTEFLTCNGVLMTTCRLVTPVSNVPPPSCNESSLYKHQNHNFTSPLDGQPSSGSSTLQNNTPPDIPSVPETPLAVDENASVKKTARRRVFGMLNGGAMEKSRAKNLESVAGKDEEGTLGQKQSKGGKWKKLGSKASRIFKSKKKQNEKIESPGLVKSFSRFFGRHSGKSSASDHGPSPRRRSTVRYSNSLYVSSNRGRNDLQPSYSALVLPAIPSVCLNDSELEGIVLSKEYFSAPWILSESVSKRFSKSVPEGLNRMNDWEF